ncbi:Gar1/Naf1 family protein [Halovenus halobia]|uniref:Gar1/Naf1 family protein n=1 Tax=Halovenus halobia TaxID=3396622 RepID=UPI003F57C21C
MKRIGEAVRMAQGKLIVRSPDDSHPDLGSDVIDEDLNDVGTVVSVFGPVERPYLAVLADRDDAALLVGSPLYARQ